MSKSRRSLIRSTFENIRRLWKRREDGRREMRRCLGSTFELLEPRLAMTISAPLPSATDHIHPVLQIYIDGQQTVIPSGVGIVGDANPHTHDYTGTLHVGEGAPAGTGSTVRNVTLQDFFDVWRSSSLTASGIVNANAIFDTDLTDGTNQPRIMNKTVDSTHVLRMYVKESADSAPQLEYDSSSSSNNLTRPELYVPRDLDQVIITYETNTAAVDGPSFQPFATQTVLGGAPLFLGIDGFDPTGGPLTYTVTSSNPNLLQATLQPTSNKSMVMNVAGFGQMTFQLFDNLSPRTTQHIESLIASGEYNNSSGNPVKFYRISHLNDGSDFVIQGGPQDSTSPLGAFDDEFNLDLQFTGSGLLAMAKSTDDTNDSQLFITGAPTRFLDMQHSIFGVLTDGDEVREAIQQARATGDGPPPSDIVITTTEVITDTQNAALKLKAAEGASGTAQVTLTVSDAQGHTFAQVFQVNVTPDTANSAPFLNPIAPVTGVTGQPITVQLTAQDAENNPNFFDATKPTGETVNYAVTVNHDTGLVTITPPADFAGTFRVTMGVRGVATTTTSDQFDQQNVLVTVAPDAPTSLDLTSATDSGTSNSDNITNASSLNIQLSNLIAGATVTLLKGSTPIATGVATGSTMTLTVSNPGTSLGQGASAITATQTVSGQTSAASTALNVTFDTTAPTFTSVAPTTAQVGFNLNYNAQTDEETATSGLVYTLTSAPTGATINSSTGVVTWSPTSGQAPTQTFNIVATDAAGNAATQSLSIAVAPATVDITITLTKPDGTALTTLTAGQDFVLHVFGQDVRSAPHGVFALYTDITFDGAKATVTGPITYSSAYGSGRSGTATGGLIDEAGAFAGTSETGSGVLEVFSVPMRATAAGTITFATDPAETTPGHDVLVYGTSSTAVADANIHYGSASIEIGATFNAVNDAFNATEDTANNTINPLANDASIGGSTNTLTISAVGTPSNGGTVTRTENNTRISYTPAANFKGTETFTYTARNQNGEEHPATVTMTVGDANDPPVAVNDTFSASRNSSANALNVLANDTQGLDSGETLRVSAVGTGSAGGTITIGTNGTNILYTPANNFSGTETFTYTISDRAAGVAGALTSTATVTVNVSGLTANNDSGTGFTFDEDSGAHTIDVLANDALDSQVGGTLTITSVGTTDKGGTVTITQNSTRLSYTSASNFQGTEKFTYTISDGQGHTATATVTMTVNNLNDPPTAVADTLTAFKDTKATFDVLANDTSTPDPTETLTIDSISTAPQHGTATIVNGKVEYTPASGYTGADSFVYTIKDPSGATATATANITVQDFVPSTLSGFVYFDVNNNGVKDAGELAIVGITITLTGTATAGSNTTVNTTMKTAEDGSYKFENLAPGTYQIKETQPLFVIDGQETAGSQGGTLKADEIDITLAQNTTGINNNFGEVGRQVTTISIRDFFSSTSRNYAQAAFDNAGVELWHSTSGEVWQGYTKNTFALMNSQSQIKLDSTNAQSQVITRQLDTTLPVYQSGVSGTNSLYYMPGGPGTTTTTNLTPTAVADTFSTAVSTALTVTAANGVLKNDTDPENATLTASIVTQPTHGTITLSSSGSFTYTPTTGFTGTDSFTYKASDGTNQSAAATVTINVGTNTAPTAVADAFTATEDTVLTVAVADGVLKNDTDPQGNTLTAVIDAQPTKGTVSLASNGSFTYTPNANATGTDTFTYKANDGSLSSASATVTITITAVNDAPVAANDTFSTPRNTTLTTTTSTTNLLSNDTDPDGTTPTVVTTPVVQPTHGTVTLNANGTFTYVPTTDFVGTDTFTYQITDGTQTSNATATINVTNNSPVATADSYTATEDTALTIVVGSGVLANDTDPDTGTTLTAINASTPGHGTVTLNTSGSFTYTPNADFAGTDTFTYQASDGTSTSTATVTITVQAVNDAPVGVADSYRVAPDTILTITPASGVLANDTDVDNTLANLTATIVAQATHGNVQLGADGSFTYTPTESGFVGTDTFTYRAKDNASPQLESAITTVTIVVNSAPVSQNDTFTTNEDVTLNVVAPGILQNDSDANSDTLTAIFVGQQPLHGTLTFNTNGSFTYIPNANFVGTDSFRYQASDGIAAGTPATVTINVTAVNDAPSFTLAGNPAAVNEDAGDVEVTGFATAISAGPSDESSQTLTFALTPGTTTGNLSFTTAPTIDSTGKLTYRPAADTNGTATFTVVLSDNGSGTAPNDNTSNPQTITITVNAVNDTPVRTSAAPEAITVDEDDNNTTAVSLGLSGLTYLASGGSDEASQTLIAIKLTNIPSSIAVFQADGLTAVDENTTLTLEQLQGLTYKTLADANGTSNLTWTVQDSGGTANGGVDTLIDSVAIVVNPINDAPSFSVPTGRTVDEDSGTTTVNDFASAISTGPTNESSQTLSFDVTVTNTTGNLSFATPPAIDATGKLTFTLTADSNGTATVTAVLHDSGSGTAPNVNASTTKTFTITVDAVNDAPVLTSTAAADVTVDEDSANSAAATLGFTGVTYGAGGGSDETSQTLAIKLTSIPSFIKVFQANGTTEVVANESLTLAQFQGLTYETIANANGSADLTWTVQDSDGTANGGVDTLADSITITVDAVNDAPSFTLAGDPADIDEDAAAVTVNNFATAISNGPSNESGQTHQFTLTVTGTTGTLAFTTAPAIDANGNLTYQVAPDTNGDATISVVLADNGSGVAPNINTSAAQTFTITVNAVNDAPSFTLAADPPDVEEDAGAQTVPLFITNISAGPGNESTQTLSFTVTVTGGTLSFTSDPAIDENGNLTYTVANGSSGTATVSVVLTDSGPGTAPDVNVSAAQMFTITVNAGNQEGEGESSGLSANDLALLWLLTNSEGEPGSLEVSDADWLAAVDAAMAQLG